MHAVLLEVDVTGVEREAGFQGLREQIVPAISQLSGFQSGTWLTGNESSSALSLTVLDTEANAQIMAERFGIWIQFPDERNDLPLRGARSRRDRVTLTRSAVSTYPEYQGRRARALVGQNAEGWEVARTWCSTCGPPTCDTATAGHDPEAASCPGGPQFRASVLAGWLLAPGPILAVSDEARRASASTEFQQ
jgi:hypothetical protein